MPALTLRDDQLRAFAAAAARRARLALPATLAEQGLAASWDAAVEELTIADRCGRRTRVRFSDHRAQITAPDDGRFEVAYDDASQVRELVDPSGNVTAFRRDATGRIIEIRRADGSRYGFDWAPDGTVRAIHWPDGTACLFRHDEQGRLIQVEDEAGQVRTQDYDEYGRLERIDFGDGRALSFAFDAAGELDQAVEPDGTRIDYADAVPDGAATVLRNGRLRLLVRAVADGEEVLQVHPDGSQLRSRFEKGRRVLSATADSKVQFTYDAAGLLVAEDVNGAVVTWERDASGLLSAIVDPDGRRTIFERDAAGRLSRVHAPDGAAWELCHTAGGTLERIVHPNGLVARRRHNALGLLEGMVVDKPMPEPGEHPLLDVAWTYDGRDRVRQETQAGLGRRHFTYAAGGRLVRVDADRPENGEAYELDARGNRLVSNGAAARFDLADRITAWNDEPIGHDGDGNVAACVLPVGHARLIHDSFGRLAEVRTAGMTARYRYDAIGRRADKTIHAPDGTVRATTRYRWAASMLISEVVEVAGAPPQRIDYIPAPDLGVHLGMRIEEARRAARVYCLHQGRRNEVLMMTDHRARPVWEGRYTAFGEARVRDAIVHQPFRLMGQYHDAETGLHYNVARYYHPGLGRYLERDPLGFAGGSWNDYLYADGDPLNRVDPTGEFLPVLLAGAAIGAGIGAGIEMWRQYRANPDAPFDWGRIGKEAAVGGAVGVIGAAAGIALAPFAGALGAGALAVAGGGALVGGIGAAIEACAEAELRGEPINVAELLRTAGIGATIGTVTAGVGGVIAARAARTARRAAITGRARQPIIVTKRGVAMTPELLSRQGTSKFVGNFRGIKGATIEDIVSRVPRNWTLAPQQSGMGIRFLDETGVERLRLHGPSSNPNIPADSNSRMGWTARVHVPGTKSSYYDSLGNVVGKNANEGHIPIYGNPNAGL
jgi:RHS repeat-associated protein